MKILLVLGFLAILASLGTALFFMMRSGSGKDDRRRSRHMASALALRIALSVLLFVCLLFAWKMGYIRPTGVPLQ